MDAVFKVFRQSEWDQFNSEGKFSGSEHDLRDGFIHLSQPHQVEGVVSRYFAGETPVYIAKFSGEELLKKLILEPAKSGEKFPHLYNEPLRLSDMESFEVKLL